VKLFPGVSELFRHIGEQGLKIAIASSAKADELKVYKKIAGVEWRAGLAESAQGTAGSAVTEGPDWSLDRPFDHPLADG
jgi:hypothetical protein